MSSNVYLYIRRCKPGEMLTRLTPLTCSNGSSSITREGSPRTSSGHSSRPSTRASVSQTWCSGARRNREGSQNFKYIFIFKSRQRILSLCSVRKRIYICIFNNRTLDRDSSGTIGFLELMRALDLVGADKWELTLISYKPNRNHNFKRFQDEVSWAFKMFDIDNSGNIVVEEIRESVQVGRKG